jgi:hypothetical protein
MSDATIRAACTRWAPCVRRLGLDRNPLRRPADRIETAVRLATAMLILVAVPIATLAAGLSGEPLNSEPSVPIGQLH